MTPIQVTSSVRLQIGLIVLALAVSVLVVAGFVEGASDSGTVTLNVGEYLVLDVDETEDETEISWDITVQGGSIDVFAVDADDLRLYEEGENFSVLRGLTETNVSDDRETDFVQRDKFYIILDYSCTNCTNCDDEVCPGPSDPSVNVTYDLDREEVEGGTIPLYCGLCLGFAGVGAIVALFRMRNEAREEAHDDDHEVVSLTSISSPSLITIGGRPKKEPTPGQMEVWREAVRADFDDE